jgi:DNA-directed RNA polymerase specialized sigma24 family protein
MVVPLAPDRFPIVEANADLPARVAARWAPYYGLDREDLAGELAAELIHVAARMPIDPKRPPRNYLYAALHQRIKELIKSRSRLPDLREYAREPGRSAQPTPLEEMLRWEEEEENDLYADWRG